MNTSRTARWRRTATGTQFLHDAGDALQSHNPDVGLQRLMTSLRPCVWAMPALLALAPLFGQSASGYVIVNGDEWTLANDGGYSVLPQETDQFVRNLSAFFAAGGNGRFLINSQNFGLTQPRFLSTLRTTGSVVVAPSVSYTIGQLLGFDAVFLGGPINGATPDNETLIEYVKRGGNVYLATGTDAFTGSGPRAFIEAEAWNRFLTYFGLELGDRYVGPSGSTTISDPHPLFHGVGQLFFYGESPIRDIAPRHAGSATLAVSPVTKLPLFGISRVQSVLQRFDVSPNPVSAGRNATWATMGGLPGYPVVLMAEAINGSKLSPIAWVAGPAQFDASGKWSMALPIPPGLAGLRLTFVTVTLSEPLTGLDWSNRVDMVFQ